MMEMTKPHDLFPSTRRERSSTAASGANSPACKEYHAWCLVCAESARALGRPDGQKLHGCAELAPRKECISTLWHAANTVGCARKHENNSLARSLAGRESICTLNNCSLLKANTRWNRSQHCKQRERELATSQGAPFSLRSGLRRKTVCARRESFD